MKIIRNKKDKEKGVALLLTIIVLSIILLSSVFIADIAMTQLKLSNDTSDSVKAIYAADAGIEWQFYQITKRKTVPSPIFLNGASVVEVSAEIVENMPKYTIRSLGSSGLVKRQFEVLF